MCELRYDWVLALPQALKDKNDGKETAQSEDRYANISRLRVPKTTFTSKSEKPSRQKSEPIDDAFD